MDVTLYDRRDYADMIKLRTLRWEDYPGGPDVITRILVKGKWEKQRQTEVT